jgi:spoIIIJ-associated protein
MDRNQTEQKIKEILNTIFRELSVEAELKFPEERNKTDERFYVEIETPDTNLIIGYHGETLNSLQHLLNVMLFKEVGEGVGVLVDISGYRLEREKKLIDLAENASEKAKAIQKSVALYPMNSYERKIVHDKVGEIEGVTSSSEGEGYNRRVIITPDNVE